MDLSPMKASFVWIRIGVLEIAINSDAKCTRHFAADNEHVTSTL